MYIPLIALCVLPALGCNSDSHREGPAQEMGREIDDSVRDLKKDKKTPTEKVGEAIKDFGDKIEDEN